MSHRPPKDSDETCPYHGVIEKCVGDLTQDMRVIKNTLIGQDMRGGIVGDVAELKSTMGQIKSLVGDVAELKGTMGQIKSLVEESNNTKEEVDARRALNRKERYALLGTSITAGATVIVAAIDYIIKNPDCLLVILKHIRF